mmetsp:Transcript_11655/g.16516  ORF Transcript_11655/g.16516 Transcript_11655/m.16516 type:complete len:380 (+) Transcript_11655:253-1392(+)
MSNSNNNNLNASQRKRMRTSSTNKRNAISTSGVTMNTKKKLRNPSTRVNFIDNEEEDNHSNNNITKYPNAKNEDAYISSEEDIDSVEDDDDEEEEEEETVDAKRVRLAREYLTKMEQMEHGTNSSSSTSSSSSSIDSDDDDHDKDDSKREEDREDNLTKRLRKERLKREGLHESYRAHLVQSSISSHWKYLQQQQQSSSSVSHISRITTTTQKEYEARQWIESGRVQCRRGHDLTPTCVALHDSGSFAYSGSKDGSIIMWDVERGGIRIQNVVSKWNAATTTTTTTTKLREERMIMMMMMVWIVLGGGTERLVVVMMMKHRLRLPLMRRYVRWMLRESLPLHSWQRLWGMDPGRPRYCWRNIIDMICPWRGLLPCVRIL